MKVTNQGNQRRDHTADGKVTSKFLGGVVCLSSKPGRDPVSAFTSHVSCVSGRKSSQSTQRLGNELSHVYMPSNTLRISMHIEWTTVLGSHVRFPFCSPQISGRTNRAQSERGKRKASSRRQARLAVAIRKEETRKWKRKGRKR